jgi:hypothetical protein
MTAWLKRASRAGRRLASASTAPAPGSSAELLNVSQPIERDPDGTDRRLTIFRDILRGGCSTSGPATARSHSSPRSWAGP